MTAPKATSKTFSIRTLTWERHKKLKQNTDVVITLGPIPIDGDSVMGQLNAIPWKILSFPANSDTCRVVTIHPKIAVSTVKEKENFVLTPQISEILTEGTETILKFNQEGRLQWISAPQSYGKNIIHGGLTVERAEPTQARFISDDWVIKNEYEETRLALCLVDHDDTRLPIVDLGRLPSVPVLLFSTALTTPHVERIKDSHLMDSYVCKLTPWQNRRWESRWNPIIAQLLCSRGP
ncbi:uncharacterized protein BJ212DRAFT_150373 [Suillus subaureus]|uniref:Uncharacterized protein n=1 Tax=Suillus subaureus TaxID=48587 RepID=A0A9P7ECQ1_9AGAM|nr:uncharacterized protein BJ212DRAFT_150373 [Suillus subaureus]KAG1817086.1 hypothetical protein BJ212DRAFT_150373 [Suillus subaureus]